MARQDTPHAFGAARVVPFRAALPGFLTATIAFAAHIMFPPGSGPPERRWCSECRRTRYIWFVPDSRRAHRIRCTLSHPPAHQSRQGAVSLRLPDNYSTHSPSLTPVSHGTRHAWYGVAAYLTLRCVCGFLREHGRYWPSRSSTTAVFPNEQCQSSPVSFNTRAFALENHA